MAGRAPVRRNNAMRIGVVLALAALAVVLLTVFLWPSAPTTVAPPARLDAARPPSLRSPDAARPADAGPPEKKARRPATRVISERELRHIQRRGTPLLRTCVTRQRTASTGFKKITVLFQIADGGRVSSVAVDAGGDSSLAECVRRLARSWRFPAHLKAQQVVFPLLLGGAE